ncbi:MAG TPA: arginine repressor [bacterium]|jgi:transcriptional regulator of arginine metabolism
MAGTADRTRRILRVIERAPIQTQDELVAALRREGVAVTQATVSRDIKRLGLVKVPARDGIYRYALPASVQSPPPRAQEHVAAVMREFARSVETALDLILVKTVPGGAPPVAQAIDDAQWTEVAGTLAGEDTIIVVPRRKSAQRAVARRLRELLG